MIKKKYVVNISKKFDTKKEAEHFLNEMKKVTSSFLGNIETLTYNE